MFFLGNQVTDRKNKACMKYNKGIYAEEHLLRVYFLRHWLNKATDAVHTHNRMF